MDDGIRLVITSVGERLMDVNMYDSIKDPNNQKSTNSQKPTYKGDLIKL